MISSNRLAVKMRNLKLVVKIIVSSEISLSKTHYLDKNKAIQIQIELLAAQIRLFIKVEMS